MSSGISPRCLRPRRIYDCRVPLTGDYVPSPRKWVPDQVERYEATDGREANTLAGTNRPVVIFTTRGRKSGKIRKFALMRVARSASMPAHANSAARNVRSGGNGQCRPTPRTRNIRRRPTARYPCSWLNGGADRHSGGCGAFLRTSLRMDAHNAENADIRGRVRRNVTADVGASRLELLTPCL